MSKMLKLARMGIGPGQARGNTVTELPCSRIDES